ncbi:MAG: hypothetical protein AAGA48_33200 [Myxococcota bacterium]
MTWLLWTAFAFAGGGGGYAELSLGAAWNDFAGPVVRGGAIGIAGGAFWGPYTATLQYGRYNRAGLRLSAVSAAPVLSGPETALVSLGPEFGGGVDLLKAGAFWRISVEGAVLADDSLSEDPEFRFGLIARVAAGGVWWFTRPVGLTFRLEGGPNYILERQASLTGGIGFGLFLRGGAVGGRKRRERAIEEEIQSFDPMSVPLEEPRVPEVPPPPEPESSPKVDPP